MEKGVTAPGNTPKCSINLFDEPNDNRPTPILNCKLLRSIKVSWWATINILFFLWSLKKRFLICPPPCSALKKASCTLFDSLTVFNGTCSKYLYCTLQLSSFFINASDEIGKRCWKSTDASGSLFFIKDFSWIFFDLGSSIISPKKFISSFYDKKKYFIFKFLTKIKDDKINLRKSRNKIIPNHTFFETFY
jgi:hypothetical protein